MRRLHRWFGIVSSLFFLFVAITGLALQAELWMSGKQPYGVKSAKPKQITVLVERTNNLEAPQLVQRAIAVLNENNFSDMPQSIGFSKTSTGWVLSVSQAGNTNKVILGSHSAKLAPAIKPNTSVPWHLVFQNWHAGYSYGLIGRILSCLVGLSLIFLSGSGLYMYWGQYRRRTAQGRRNLFW